MTEEDIRSVTWLDGQRLTIEDVLRVARRGVQARLTPSARHRVSENRAWVDAILADEQAPVIYGINTGFGSFAGRIIPHDLQARLSRNLALSHATGVGNPFPEEVVRASMVIRANTLAKGHSGLRLEVLDTLLDMLNAGVHPVMPEKGSLGASGDLAPLSHLLLVLSADPSEGEAACGEAFYQGERLRGDIAMARAGIQPVRLSAKEGLAINNGTSVSTALAALALYDAENALAASEIALAMTLEALRGSSAAYDERIHAARSHPGQSRVAARVRELLAGSELLDSSGRVQDAYSLRCAPQVLGAVRDVFDFARQTITRELSAATDNPLIFLDLPGPNKALSGGNFHGQPVAFALDFLAVAAAEASNLAERRIFRLTDPALNDGLPAMLVDEGGLNSGLMLAQYTAAALVSDNKTLAHPDSVDSIPTSANQEDHVSMSANAGRHAAEVVRNFEHVVAIELLCAAQALDFRLRAHPAIRLGRGTGQAYERIRERVAFLPQDRPLYPDIQALWQMVHEAELLR